MTIDFQLFTYSTVTSNVVVTQQGNLGVGTTQPKTKLQVSNGDVYIDNPANGVIMKSPNGSCYRLTVSNAGAPVFTAIACP